MSCALTRRFSLVRLRRPRRHVWRRPGDGVLLGRRLRRMVCLPRLLLRLRTRRGSGVLCRLWTRGVVHLRRWLRCWTIVCRRARTRGVVHLRRWLRCWTIVCRRARTRGVVYLRRWSRTFPRARTRLFTECRYRAERCCSAADAARSEKCAPAGCSAGAGRSEAHAPADCSVAAPVFRCSRFAPAGSRRAEALAPLHEHSKLLALASQPRQDVPDSATQTGRDHAALLAGAGPAQRSQPYAAAAQRQVVPAWPAPGRRPVHHCRRRALR